VILVFQICMYVGSSTDGELAVRRPRPRDPAVHERRACAASNGPPRSYASPNGDTPLADGSMLVTEIGGSWIDLIGPKGQLEWAVVAPASYPSDAHWLGHGTILVADYHSPGAVIIMRRSGHVLWRYGPSSGPGMLDHPSLAIRLPNGLIAVNDDYRH
jgi:hypothetical protein